MKKIYFLYFILLSFTAFSQQYYAKSGNLNIACDSKEKFFVYVNGELQNKKSQNTIRIENLKDRYYDIKIVFENKTLKDINNHHVSVRGKDGLTFEETIYKVKIDSRNKKTKLNYFSSSEIVPPYEQPANVLILDKPSGNSNNIYNEININVNQNNKRSFDSKPDRTKLRDEKCYEMQDADFEIAINAIKKENFDDQKLAIAQNIIVNNCLLTTQISRITKTLSFSNNQLQFVKMAYESCLDLKNYYLLKDVFSFEIDKQAFLEFINSKAVK